MKVLFILKSPGSMSFNSYSNESNTGIFISARMLKNVLASKFGCTTELKFIDTLQDIKDAVKDFKPALVVVEAYWLAPDDFITLTTRFPNVKWVVRNHSATPFLSLEGTIVDWMLQYLDIPNVIVACNEKRTALEFQNLVAVYRPSWDDAMVKAHVVLLPDYYHAMIIPRTAEEQKAKDAHRKAKLFDVACFGAIRPLKNQLIQAIAAIDYAESHNLKLSFHINVTDSEKDSATLKNLRALFGNLPKYTLVEHPWLEHREFLQLCRIMDLGMQVTFSETFNIATADLVVNNVPVVVSPEIFWVDKMFQADPTDCADITQTIGVALKSKIRGAAPSLAALADPDDTPEEIFAKIEFARGEQAAKKNIEGLQDYDDWSLKLWEKFLFHS